MEEAFNRSSVGSSIRTTGAEAQQDISQYDTPPTSFTNTRNSGGSSIATPNVKAVLSQRPLPPIPTETPNTFLHRKLAETRAEIARRLDEDGDNTDHFKEVLENLDRLMQPVLNTKRTVSAPVKAPVPLQVIPEERNDTGEGSEQSGSHRVVTGPMKSQTTGAMAEQQTIRIVDLSPTRVAPLNIRKRSGASTNSKSTNEMTSVPWSGSVSTAVVWPYQEELLAARSTQPPPATEKEATIKKKKSLWFRRSAEEKDRGQEQKENQIKKKSSNTGLLQIPDAWQGLDDRLKNNATQATDTTTAHTTKQSDGSNESEFPMRNSSAPATKSDAALRKGFFGLFGKKSKEDKGKRPMERGGKLALSPQFSRI
jgi:serine/threonine-protein kinase HSL1 (negative regulator of Swe1 kinase)